MILMKIKKNKELNFAGIQQYLRGQAECNSP